MVSLILGKKGSGKTKRLIEKVNEAIEKSNGNVVCVEKQPKLEGRQMLMFIAANNAKPPKKGKKPQKQQASKGDAPAEKSE